jgi:parallel beta-helix repeat protein
MTQASVSIRKQGASGRLGFLLALLGSFLLTSSFAAATLSITTTSPLPNGTMDTLYSTTFAATGGTAPYAWTITSGSVPGLAMDSTGVLNGVPTVASAYSITVQVMDSTSPNHLTASATFNLTTAVSTNTNFYVAPPPTGSDTTGTGHLTAPWATISHAISKVAGPGVTINVAAGTYNERVAITTGGSAAGGYFIIRNSSYPAVATINGAGLTPGTGGYAYGLLDINNSGGNIGYVTVDGFEIYNFTTTNDSLVPAGIHVEGSGSNIQLVNNHVHHIWNTGTASSHDGTCGNPSPEAFGLIVVGTNGAAPLTNITISGNELNDLQTGCSESFTVNGDVNHFIISGNKVHNNSNIGIAALGGECVASGITCKTVNKTKYDGSPNDQASYGVIRDNTVYTIHSNSQGSSGVYGLNQYCDDGIYLDGSAYVTVERNIVYDVDLGIEVTGEGSPQNTTNNVMRDNLFYYNSVVGISIGGQGAAGGGGSSNTTVVNNTTWSNGLISNNNVSPLGEFATGTALKGTNTIANNIFYATPAYGVLVSAVTTSTIALNNNLYYFVPNSNGTAGW